MLKNKLPRVEARGIFFLARLGSHPIGQWPKGFLAQNKFWQNLLVIFSAGAIFLLGFQSFKTNDIFFGLKIGEIVVKSGHVPSTEIFSWSAYGREIVAYEWLAQVLIYLVFLLGGLWAIGAYSAFMYALFFYICYRLFRLIGRDYISSLVLAVFLSVSVYEFFVPRPQIVAFVFLVLTLYLIFLYLLKGKNRLFWLLPITYLWANSHASFVFVIGFLGSYGLLGLFAHRYFKKTLFTASKAKVLLFFAGLCFLVTLLPPIGFKVYLLIWSFIVNVSLISHFVVEWGPVAFDKWVLWFYLLLFLFAAGLILTFGFSIKKRDRLILALPLLAIGVVSFEAIRHVVFGTIVLVVTICLFLPKPVRLGSRFKFLGAAILVLLVTVSVFLISQKRQFGGEERLAFEQKVLLADVQFMKKHNLPGRMYNEFALGSYLLYYLYPQYQVFFDGRADVYLCCEVKDFLPVIAAKDRSQDQFKREVGRFLKKYDFSYLVIPYPDYNPLEFTSSTLMANVLLDSDDWTLVYFSDGMQIIARKNRQNERIIADLGMRGATPYGFLEYRRGKQQQALADYQKMISVADSGVARSGLGQTLLALGRDDEAYSQFKKAITTNPYLYKPFLGLAKIALKKGDVKQAEINLKKVIEMAPYLGEAYLVLGTLYENRGESDLASAVYEKGLMAGNIDLLSRQKMVVALHRLGR